MSVKKWILFVCLFTTASLLSAQDGGKDFKAKSISIFKNGTAFLVKSGDIKSSKGIYKMDKNIPNALFGTFWFHSPNDKLKQVTSYTDQITQKAQIRASSFLHMLDINMGKRVRLFLGQDEIIEGKVEEIEKPATTTENPTANPLGLTLNNLITFSTADSWLTFSVGEIRRIEFLEQPRQFMEQSSIVNKPIVQLDFSNKAKQQKVDMMYLANNLSWTPNYLVELIDDTKARLTLRAEVVNDLEDINNTDLNFVVGVPNFRFANRLSSLVDFFTSYAPVNGIHNFSNSLQNVQLNGYEIAEESVSSFSVPNSNPAVGSSQEDLFFYQLKDFSLRKGGRGHFPIFQVPIEIAHIYECNLIANNANQRTYQENFLFNADEKNTVFHSIRVNNETEMPWTTGSAMVVKGINNPKPISQDRLNYTPIKGHSFVKLTEAPDVKVKHAEREVDRKDKAIANPTNQRYFLDLVTVEGQLKVKNYKNKEIKLNLRRTVTGELLESNIEWLKSEQVVRGGQNSIVNVCWETSIKAGEELIIKYTYKVYVPD